MGFNVLFMLSALPCPVTLVDTGAVLDSVVLNYTDSQAVVCDGAQGYRTPTGDSNFTVLCGFDGNVTYLEGVTGCEGTVIVHCRVLHVVVILSHLRWPFECTYIKKIHRIKTLNVCYRECPPSTILVQQLLLLLDTVAFEFPI